MEGVLPNYDSSFSVDFPDDCLACIFSHIRREDLPKVRLVCHRFFDIVNSSSFFREFCLAHGYTLPSLEWRKFAKSQNRHFDFRIICKGFNPYGSICPEDYFVGRLSADELNWGKQRTFNATDQFGPFRRICRRLARETPPIGLRESDLPPKFDTCFATSYVEGARTYEIDLVRLGIEEWVLDHARPRIIIEEWTAPRFDCASEYSLTATLPKECRVCNEDLQSGHRSQLSRKYVQWDPLLGFERNELVLENYSSGVRMLVIRSASRDTQGWAGNYGCKFAGLTIRFELPSKLEFVELWDSECGHSLSSESSYPPCEHDNYFPSPEEESDADVDPDEFLPDGHAS